MCSILEHRVKLTRRTTHAKLTLRVLAWPRNKARGNFLAAGMPEDPSSSQEAILFLVYRVRFHFHHVLAGHREDLLQTPRGLERRQRKEEVSNPVVPGQGAVRNLAVKAVPQALLTRLE